MPGNPAAAIGEMCGAWLCMLVLVPLVARWFRGETDTNVMAALISGGIAFGLALAVWSGIHPDASMDWPAGIYGSGAFAGAAAAVIHGYLARRKRG